MEKTLQGRYQKQQHRQVTDSNKVGEIVEVMISGGSVEVDKRGEMRGSGSNGVEYGGMGSINGQILKRVQPGWVG